MFTPVLFFAPKPIFTLAYNIIEEIVTSLEV